MKAEMRCAKGCIAVLRRANAVTSAVVFVPLQTSPTQIWKNVKLQSHFLFSPLTLVFVRFLLVLVL